MPYSYNEYVQHRQSLHRLFLPGALYFTAEATFAGLILLLLNLSNIENHLMNGIPGQTLVNPFEYIPLLVGKLLEGVGNYQWASRLTLFIVWAVLGMMVYVLCYRAIQIATHTTHALKTGLYYMQNDGTTGYLRWLGTAHDTILRFLLKSGGLLLTLLGAFLVFSYANFELQIGFSGIDSAPLLAILIGLVTAVAGMRLLVIGLCLVFGRFRRWYIVQ